MPFWSSLEAFVSKRGLVQNHCLHKHFLSFVLALDLMTYSWIFYDFSRCKLGVFLFIFWLLWSSNDEVKMAHLVRFLVLSPAYAKEQLPWLQKLPEVCSRQKKPLWLWKTFREKSAGVNAVYMKLLNRTTLRTESPSIFLDKSGRGRNLCRHPRQFILSMLQIQIFLRRQSNRYRKIHCVCQQM